MTGRRVRSSVCAACERRLQLLDRFGAELDRRALDAGQLRRLLGLGDSALAHELASAAERRRHNEHRSRGQRVDLVGGVAGSADCVCRHHCAYPGRLLGCPQAPTALRVRGGAARLSGLLAGRVVTILGGARASDYGFQTARELASGLAACGVTVASGLDGEISLAAQDGVLRTRRAAVAILAHDLGRCSPAWCGSVYSAIQERGCAISSIATEPVPRSWSHTEALSTLVLLADLTILVEARIDDQVLACAEMCEAYGVPLAAVPGPVDSPRSDGTNALIAAGAHVVCQLQSALDLLYGPGVRRAHHTLRRQRPTKSVEQVALEPGLAKVLERVSKGEDTLDTLRASRSDAGELELALTELELLGLLRRGAGGRYLPSAV